MKALVIFLAILIIIGLLFIVTKPSDQACIDGMESQINTAIDMSNQNVLLKAVEEVGVNYASHYAFRMEDCIFYKNIYLIGTNVKVGTGILGIVTLSPNAINEIKTKQNEENNNLKNQGNSILEKAKKSVENVFNKTKSEQDHQNQTTEESPLIYWQNRLLLAKAHVDADNANLRNLSQFHLGRLPSTKKKELNNASIQLEQDKIVVLQYSDSVRKYQ